jgi:hypothetical protein
VGGATVESLPVPAAQDRALVAFADGEVDRPGGSGHERDRAGLVAFTENVQGAVPALKTEVFDVGAAGLGDTETVQSEEHRQSGVVAVEPLGGEQERAELPTVHPPTLTGLHLGSTDVLGRVRRMPVDVSESIEPTHRREPPVDRRRRQPTFLHRRAIQLNVRRRCLENLQPAVSRPLKKHAQVMPVASSVRPVYRARNATTATCASSKPSFDSGASITMLIVPSVVTADLPCSWKNQRTPHQQPALGDSGDPVTPTRRSGAVITT